MNNNKINYLELSSLIIILIVTTFLGIGVYSVIKVSAVDSYINVFLSSIVGMILIFIFIYLFNYEPNLPINQKINKLFGKAIGTFFNILLWIGALTFAISIMYNLINFVVSQFLSETPFVIVGILFAIIIVYINIKGIDIIARVSLILVNFNIILFLIAVLGLIPSFDINNFKPFLKGGLIEPVKGIFYVITLNLNTMFILLIIPKNSIKENKNYKKYIILSYIFASIIIFFIIFMIIGTLGIYLASYYQYPEYMVFKKINLFGFLDRIENFLIIQWIFGSFISLSIVTYYLTNVIKNYHKSKLLPIIIIIITIVLSLNIFPNNTSYNNFSYNIMPYIRLSIIIFNAFMCLIIYIKKKRKPIQSKYSS